MTTVPDWVAKKLTKWAAEGLTGEFRLTFRHGVVQHWSEDVRGQPPAEGMTAGSRCPKCSGPLRECDYGERQECPKCGESWTVWQLARLRATASG